VNCVKNAKLKNAKKNAKIVQYLV